VDLVDLYSAKMEAPRIDDTLCQIEANELLELDLKGKDSTLFFFTITYSNELGEEKQD
jgi:hypothetical protein